MFSLGGDIIRRCGTEVFVMKQSDWFAFRDKVKEKYPEMYEIFKKEMNFDLMPVEFSMTDYEIGG